LGRFDGEHEVRAILARVALDRAFGRSGAAFPLRPVHNRSSLAPAPKLGLPSARRTRGRRSEERASQWARARRLLGSVVAGAALGVALAPPATAAATSSYDQLIVAHNPAMYLPMSSPSSGREADLTGRGHEGIYHPAGVTPSRTVLPNGDPVADFDGISQYLQVPDANDLSVISRGRLTIEAWIRPDTLRFASEERCASGKRCGYVHLLGKGEPGQHEYVARMYSKRKGVKRPNRISGYAFNLTGGFGSGSFFQDRVTAGAWLLVHIVINTHHTSRDYPTGYVKIFKSGELRQTTRLDQFGVVPGNGTAPFRVGTRDLGSFFAGAIGKVAVYLHELTPARIESHYSAMVG
jgi:Concanavalin A-like lectin/glucanases superfamily